MTILEDNAGESGGQNELLSTFPFPRLPKEPRALIAILSTAKRNAIIACFHASALNKKDGAWPGYRMASGHLALQSPTLRGMEC